MKTALNGLKLELDQTQLKYENSLKRLKELRRDIMVDWIKMRRGDIRDGEAPPQYQNAINLPAN